MKKLQRPTENKNYKTKLVNIYSLGNVIITK